MLGCGFHWAQAVERQFSEHGLIAVYKDKTEPLRDLLRKVITLPYLPAEEIPTAFNRLEDITISHGDTWLVNLFEYVCSTWLESGVWSVASWSVYKRMVQTNNDTEGCHRRQQDLWQCAAVHAHRYPAWRGQPGEGTSSAGTRAEAASGSEEHLHHTSSKDTGSLAGIRWRPFECKAAVVSCKPMESFMNMLDIHIYIQILVIIDMYWGYDWWYVVILGHKLWTLTLSGYPVIYILWWYYTYWWYQTCTGCVIGDGDCLWTLTIGIPSYKYLMIMMYWWHQTCPGLLDNHCLIHSICMTSDVKLYLYMIYLIHRICMIYIIWYTASVWHLMLICICMIWMICI